MLYPQCCEVQLLWAIAFPVSSCFSKSTKVFCWQGCLWALRFLLLKGEFYCRLRRQGFCSGGVRREYVPPWLSLPWCYGPFAQRGLSWCICALCPAPASVLCLWRNFGSESRSPSYFGPGKCLQCSFSSVVKHTSLWMIPELLDVVMSVFHLSWRRQYGVRPGSHAGLKQSESTKYVVFFQGRPLVPLIPENRDFLLT